MVVQLLFVFVVVFLVGGDAMKMPPFMKVCARNDPNFKECALNSGREATPILIQGDRKWHIPDMNPLVIEHLTVAATPSALGLNIDLDDMKFYGMTDAEIVDLDIDFDKQMFSYHLRIPRSVLLTNYNISGKILILPITGHGLLNMTLIDFEYRLNMGFDLVKKENGKEYMVMGDGKMVSKQKKGYVKFENLFNGDKVLGEQMNVFINENFQEVEREIGPIMDQAVFLFIKAMLTNFLGKIPFNELFPLN